MSRKQAKWTPSEWAAYVRDAHGTAVDAIIEGGLRLAEAHQAYKVEPQSWGRRWDAWCKTELGLSPQAASHREALSENLYSTTVDIRQKLPDDWYSLYLLGKFRAEHAKVFEAAIAEGRINPSMRQKDVKELCGSASREQRTKEDAATEAEAITSGADWSVACCDFRDWEIASGSVDLVLTDPPYADTNINEYIDLPHYADRWLGENGWLGVMVGQRHLPKLLSALASGPLEYVWTFALTSSASRAHGIQFLKVQSNWKPLILLRKGRLTLREWTLDHISYEWKQNNGDHHKWQQDISPFQKLIRTLSDPGGNIADPFCGSGTTGRAALYTGRRFTGCDIEEKYASTTATLLDSLENELLAAMGENVQPLKGKRRNKDRTA